MKSLLLLILLFTCSLFAESKVKVTNSYQEIQNIVENNQKAYPQDELLVVFDLDDTVLRTLDCKEANKKLKGFPRFEDKVRKCGATLTSYKVPKIIQSLQEQDFSVVALTARGERIIEGTLKQLRERLILSEEDPQSSVIDFVTAPFYNNDLKVIKFNQPGKKKVLKKKLFFKNGVAFSSGANKGLALQAYLKFIRRHYNFKRIIFIDDNPKNIRNIDNVYKNAYESMLVIHYTEYKED